MTEKIFLSGGGDTEVIMDEFDRTGFEFVLQDYSNHGGVRGEKAAPQL